MSRVRLLALALAALLLVAGCGSDEPELDLAKAFPGLSSADEERVEATLDAGGPIARHQARFRRALQEVDLAAARREVDAMDEATEALADRADEIEHQEARATFTDYAGLFRDAVRAYRHLVDLAERKNVRPKRLDAAVEQMIAATRRVQRADRELLERFTTGMTPEERQDFLDEYREYERGIERQAQPSP